MSSVTMTILLWANESNVFDGLNTNKTLFLWKQFGVDRKHEYKCIKSNKIIIILVECVAILKRGALQNQRIVKSISVYY